MRKNYLIVLAALFVAVVYVSTASATPKKRYDSNTETCRTLTFYNSGWVSVGNDLFKKNCKSCHYLGNNEGAPFLHSETKTMKGWNRVFTSKYPQCAKDGKWDNLSAEQLRKINDYLFRNAANTYDPNDAEDCG